MTAPLFLNVEQILTILMQELPDGVYPTDRADDPDPEKRSNSSSELRAHSMVLADAYLNLQGIFQDKFLTTVTPGGIAGWNKQLFLTPQDNSQPFATLKANAIAKRRANQGISLPAISTLIHGILDPLGVTFQIIPWSGQFNGTQYGAWILGYSQLGLDTILAGEDPLLGTGLGAGQTPLDCSLNYAAAGLTAQDLANIQTTAYTYEVQIYGTVSAAVLAQLDTQLTQSEPARSTHVITNNAPGPTPTDTFDAGPPGSDTLVDSVDFGTGTSPSATYDVWDFNV